jgi:hypothetical protein
VIKREEGEDMAFICVAQSSRSEGGIAHRNLIILARVTSTLIWSLVNRARTCNRRSRRISPLGSR